jgi:hypothetical protein
LSDRGSHPVARIVLGALAFRLWSAVLAFLANVVFPAHQPDQFPSPFGGSAFFDPFVRYDAGNYYQIARYGYAAGPMAFVRGGRSSIAYFPVYPLLMRWVGRSFGPRPADLYYGGIVVSWAAFVLAMVVLYRLALLDMSEERAGRAVLFAAVFPFAFFFGVVYTESTFLLFTLLAFYGFRTRRWLAGGLAGAVATATRVNGAMMLPALAWIAWRRAEPAWRDRLEASAGLLLAAGGIGAYSLYIYHLTGNPLEWAATLERWGYHPGAEAWSPLPGLVRALATRPYQYLAGERMAPYDALNGIAALAFVAAIPLVWRRFGAGYGLFMAANLWLPLSSGQFEGLGRYCAVLFPAFLWAGALESPVIATPLVVASASLYTLCLALFVKIHPLF